MGKRLTPEEKAAKAAAEVGGTPPTKSATLVDVLDKNGAFIRTYSVKVHGEDFRELAEEFAGKVEGRKVVAHEAE